MDNRLQLQPVKDTANGIQYKDNQEALDAWFEADASNLRPTTLNKYRSAIERFVRDWGDVPVWTLRKRDLWQYVQNVQLLCRFYQGTSANGRKPNCIQNQNLDQCGPACVAFKALRQLSVRNTLCAVIRFYDHLADMEVIEHNVMRDVARQWVRKTPKEVGRIRQPATLEQVKRLTGMGVPIQRRAVYAVLAKTGVRIGEAANIRIDSEHFNLEEGWLKLPSEGYAKRKGNRYVVIDSELQPVLREYLEWREVKARQLNISHDYLFIVQTGRNLRTITGGPGNTGWVRPDLKRTGAVGEGPDITFHSFRHYFSDTIKRNGIDSYWFHVLRGDVVRGTEGVYIHPTVDDIQKQYNDHRPRLA
jgi:integrase